MRAIGDLNSRETVILLGGQFQRWLLTGDAIKYLMRFHVSCWEPAERVPGFSWVHDLHFIVYYLRISVIAQDVSFWLIFWTSLIVTILFFESNHNVYDVGSYSFFSWRDKVWNPAETEGLETSPAKRPNGGEFLTLSCAWRRQQDQFTKSCGVKEELNGGQHPDFQPKRFFMNHPISDTFRFNYRHDKMKQHLRWEENITKFI
jgi:hypothetical protein